MPGTVGLQDGLCVEGDGMIGFVERFEGEGEILLRPKANILLEDPPSEASEGA